MFSSPDSDNDVWPGGRCAQLGGWWFGKCSASYLNVAHDYGIWVSGYVGVWDLQASRMLVKLN